MKKIKREFWKTTSTSLLTNKPFTISSNELSLKTPEVKTEFSTNDVVRPIPGLYIYYIAYHKKKDLFNTKKVF